MSKSNEAFEEENFEFSWGKKKGVGGKKREVQFYGSFTFDGEEYSLFDNVYLYKEDECEPYIGKLIKIWEQPDKKKKVKVLWFFRPVEIRNFLRDYNALPNEIFLASGEGVGLANINPPAANKPEMGANVGCSTSSNASEGYNFEALALDDKIEKNKVNLSSLKDLEYILKRVEAVGQLEDSFSGLKVIEFEGNCIRLSLKTFVPTGGLFDRHKLESISDMLALDHKLLIELSDGTMELKNVKDICSFVNYGR